METMTLSTLWHACDPDTHQKCLQEPTMAVTTKRPGSDAQLVVEFHPPRHQIEGDGPNYRVPTATLLGWPFVISSRLGTDKR